MVSVYWPFRALLSVLVAGFLLAAVGAVPSHAAQGAAYKLGPGDKVRVTVFNEKDLSGDFDVNDQGQIALPLIGPVQVAGHTISDVEGLITQRYGKDYLVDPHVNVEVLNYRPFFILGEVSKPGSYPYVNGMTVVNAVALAGGYTPRADKGGIYIEHGNDEKGQEHRAQESTPVLPGDVIHVPERFF
jgi:protein involved in polysaccharide export with SLBB domain